MKNGINSFLRRDPKSENLCLYELKMTLFDNGKPEEFLLFFRDFNMTLEASGTLEDGTKIQYLHMVVHGKSLCKFDALYCELEGTIPLQVELLS